MKRRVLFLAETDRNHGRYFVYDLTNDLLFEVADRKPKFNER
jgi:hypothetical protein